MKVDEEILNKIKKNYSNFSLSEKDFSILWNKTVKNIKSDANFKEISYEFKNNFIEYIELNSNNFLTQYIVNIQKNKPNDLDCLQELCERFSELEINVDFEQITNFIKGCNNLQNILQNIVFNNLNIIESGDVETIIDNNLCLQFIEVYCALFDINLNKEEIEEEYDLSGDLSPEKLIFLEMKNHSILSFQEEKELFIKYNNGDEEAKKKLITHNLKLVMSIARKYKDSHMSFDDLFNEGCIGLIRAIELFDYQKGWKFSVYATCWIRQAIVRALENYSGAIRLPSWLYQKKTSYIKAYREYVRNYQIEPTDEEMAEILKCSIKHIKRIKSLPEMNVSLNSKVGDDEKGEFGDFIANEYDLETEIETICLSEEIKKLFYASKLTEREIQVIIHCFNLDGRGEKTLASIGKKYGITRERARQIEESALKKLRKSAHITNFSDYMDNPTLALNNIKEAQKEWYKYKNKRREIENRYKKKVASTKKNIEEPIVKEEKKMTDTPKKRGRQSLKSLYEYFPTFKKEEVDIMIDALPSLISENQLNVLYKKFGPDLKNPTIHPLNQQEGNCFVNLRSRMGTILKHIKAGTFKKTNEELQEKLEEPVLCEIVEKPVKVVGEVINDNISIKILEIFQMPEFIELTHSLSLKERVIISLRLGYIEGKCFSVASISEFLKISQEEVIEIAKKGINLLKDKLNNLIDQEIEKIDSNNYVLKKDAVNEKKKK